ncbi:hypothetical protein FQA39_LY09042 [Lamprigera yunnana]|nr:hypothetical protein FQA39_LY09042 [Lamprigera yunnana]
MTSPKKDLEIIYNLQWKNNLGHVNDKANIVAMLDVPASTLNWETFKSYLLKNSGATGNDVKVSYVSIDDKEFPIESQLDFQIALYSFRQRARTGGIITLRLDSISDSTDKNGSNKRLRTTMDQPSTKSNAVAIPEGDVPEWFKNYMKEFKKEVIEEVTSSVMSVVSNRESSCCYGRKSKFEYLKKCRKNFGFNLAELTEKDFFKSVKLEQKTKIKEKKLTHESSDIANGWTIPLNVKDEGDMPVSVSIVGKHEVFITDLSGGETYEQVWEVINSGETEWTTNTELRYAWGCESLKPVYKVVKCPLLKPQEKGTVSIYVKIPRKAGTYECYWYFYHDDYRLRRWVACQFTVNPYRIDVSPVVRSNEIILPPFNFNTSTPKKLKLNSPEENGDNLNTVTENLLNMTLTLTEENRLDSCAGSESEPQSLISIDQSVSSITSAPSDEFVVLRLPQSDDDKDEGKETDSVNVCIPMNNIKVEKIDSTNDQEQAVKTGNDNDNNNNNPGCLKELDAQLQKNSDKAYVNYNGQKIAIPKSFLRPEFLATAEDAPDLIVTKTEENPVSSMTEPSNASSMTNSITENKSRLFVFPLNCPGFEVVYPSNCMHESISLNLNENYKSGQISLDPAFNYNSIIQDNRETASVLSCVGNAESMRCSSVPLSSSVYVEPPYNAKFNHSNCGGQYCQQFVSRREQSSESSCTTPAPNLPRYSTHTPHLDETLPLISQLHSNSNTQIETTPPPLPSFPDNLVTGAVNVASSAINTARTVLNMFSAKSEQGQWINGHWFSADSNTPRERALRTLHEMGFWDRNFNASLLARHNDDIQRVIGELVENDKNKRILFSARLYDRVLERTRKQLAKYIIIDHAAIPLKMPEIINILKKSTMKRVKNFSIDLQDQMVNKSRI